MRHLDARKFIIRIWSYIFLTAHSKRKIDCMSGREKERKSLLEGKKKKNRGKGRFEVAK